MEPEAAFHRDHEAAQITKNKMCHTKEVVRFNYQIFNLEKAS